MKLWQIYVILRWIIGLTTGSSLFGKWMSVTWSICEKRRELVINDVSVKVLCNFGSQWMPRSCHRVPSKQCTRICISIETSRLLTRFFESLESSLADQVEFEWMTFKSKTVRFRVTYWLFVLHNTFGTVAKANMSRMNVIRTSHIPCRLSKKTFEASPSLHFVHSICLSTNSDYRNHEWVAIITEQPPSW